MDFLETKSLRSLSRTSSVASISELVGEEEDRSLLRAGENIRVSKCDDEEFISVANHYCSRCLRGSWTDCPPEKFTVEYVSGGLTNYLYLCSLSEDIPLLENEPRKALIRIHGDIVDQQQRFYESVVFTLLSERGFGPKTYGIFYSGRVEEYIPHRHLYTRELAVPLISKLIASKTAHYHSMVLPLNKTPTFLWENMEKYLYMCAEVSFHDEKEATLFASIKNEFDFFKEYRWLRNMLTQLNSPVLFCHNDLQEGNILYVKTKDTTDITLIDYDYSSYSFRGFDIANHFCEWMYEYKGEYEDGFKVYHDGYPTPEEQRLFATEYLQTLSSLSEKISSGELSYQKFSIDRSIICTVDELLYEVNRFALASHMFWTVWSIIQAKVSKIDFRYLKYAKDRMDTYNLQKKAFGYDD